MTDIAALGFAVDSSELVKGKKALDDLTNSTGPADKAVSGLGKAFDRIEKAIASVERAVRAVEGAIRASAAVNNSAAKALDSITTAAIKVDRAVEQAGAGMSGAATAAVRLDAAIDATAMALGKTETAADRAGAEFVDMAAKADAAAAAAKRAAAAANDNTAAMNSNAVASKGNAAQATNLAYQFQDVAVTAAMGINPMMIAMQQGTQIAMVYGEMAAQAGKGASSISILGSALAAFAGPSTLVIIALTALVAGLLQLVPWTDLAKWGLHGIADILPVIAPYAAAAAAGLALLYAPAIIGGIGTLIASLYAAETAVISLGAAIYATVGLPVLLIAGFVAMAVAAVAFRDDLTKILGVDIVGVAKAGINQIIASFHGGYKALVEIVKNLPTVWAYWTHEAVSKVVEGMAWVITKAAGLLDKFITWANEKFNTGLPTIGDPAKGFKYENPYKNPGEEANQKIANAFMSTQGTDYVGKGIEAVGNFAELASTKLGKYADSIGKADEKAKKARAGEKSDADKFKDIMSNADRRIAALDAETAALGLTEEAAARLKYTQEMLNQADQKGIALSPKMDEALRNKAGLLAQAEIAAKKVKEAYDFVRDGVKGFISDFRQGLQNGEGALQSFVNAASNLLDKLISKIEDQLVDALMKAFDFGGLGGGSSGGGLLDGLLSFIIPNAKGGVYASAGLSSYSNSVVSKPTFFAFAAGAGLMGEAGPEAIMPLSRGSDGRLGVQVHQGNAGGGQAPNVTVNVQTLPGTTAEVGQPQTNASGGISIPVIMRQIKAELVDDARRMGPVASAYQGRFGLNPTRGMG